MTLLLAYSFWEIFSIVQNLCHVHVTYSFHQLLIFFWLTLAERSLMSSWISHYIREIRQVNTYSKGNKWWNKTKGHTFSPVLDVDVEESCFSFNIESKVPLQRRVKSSFSTISIFFLIPWTHLLKLINFNSFLIRKLCICRGVNLNRFIKKPPCYNFLMIFSS